MSLLAQLLLGPAGDIILRVQPTWPWMLQCRWDALNVGWTIDCFITSGPSNRSPSGEKPTGQVWVQEDLYATVLCPQISNGVWHVVFVAHSQLWYCQKPCPVHCLKFLGYPYTRFKKTVPWQRRVNTRHALLVLYKQSHSRDITRALWPNPSLHIFVLWTDIKTFFPSPFSCSILNVNPFR